MSKRPWMPFYVRDYIANTALLSLEEHGAYILLMCHLWDHASAPANAPLLHKVCRCTTDAERAACDSVVRQFFTVDGDLIRHHRIDEELAKVVQISEKRSKAAKVRYEKKPASAPANAVQVHTHSDSDSDSHTDLKKELKNPCADESPRFPVSEHFESFWTHYPKRNGKRVGKGDALAKYKVIVKTEVEADILFDCVINYGAECEATDSYPMDAKRWLVAKRWEEYRPGVYEPPVTDQPQKSGIDELIHRAEEMEGKHGEIRRIEDS